MGKLIVKPPQTVLQEQKDLLQPRGKVTSRLKGKEVCPTHFIRAVVLEQGVLAHMRLVIACVSTHEERFRAAMGGKLSDSRFQMLSDDYEQEQEELRENKAVYVQAPDKSSGHREQQIDISYDPVGILPMSLLNNLSNGETA